MWGGFFPTQLSRTGKKEQVGGGWVSKNLFREDTTVHFETEQPSLVGFFFKKISYFWDTDGCLSLQTFPSSLQNSMIRKSILTLILVFTARQISSQKENAGYV